MFFVQEGGCSMHFQNWEMFLMGSQMLSDIWRVVPSERVSSISLVRISGCSVHVGL